MTRVLPKSNRIARSHLNRFFILKLYGIKDSISYKTTMYILSVENMIVWKAIFDSDINYKYTCSSELKYMSRNEFGSYDVEGNKKRAS